MSTNNFTYRRCLEASVRNAWTVDECFGGRDFDFGKSFLPDRIAGVNGITSGATATATSSPSSRNTSSRW